MYANVLIVHILEYEGETALKSQIKNVSIRNGIRFVSSSQTDLLHLLMKGEIWMKLMIDHWISWIIHALKSTNSISSQNIKLLCCTTFKSVWCKPIVKVINNYSSYLVKVLWTCSSNTSKLGMVFLSCKSFQNKWML